VHEYPFLSLCCVDVNISVSFGLLYLLLYFFMHPIDSHYNTFFELTGSNNFFVMVFLEIFMFKTCFQEHVFQRLPA